MGLALQDAFFEIDTRYQITYLELYKKFQNNRFTLNEAKPEISSLDHALLEAISVLWKYDLIEKKHNKEKELEYYLPVIPNTEKQFNPKIIVAGINILKKSFKETENLKSSDHSMMFVSIFLLCCLHMQHSNVSKIEDPKELYDNIQDFIKSASLKANTKEVLLKYFKEIKDNNLESCLTDLILLLQLFKPSFNKNAFEALFKELTRLDRKIFGSCIMPDIVNSLFSLLANVQSPASVADIASGFGSILLKQHNQMDNNASDIDYIAHDYDEATLAILDLIFQLSKVEHYNIHSGDSLLHLKQNQDQYQVDYCLTVFPWGRGKYTKNQIPEGILYHTNSTWLWLQTMVKITNKKAITVVPQSLFNSYFDTEIKEKVIIQDTKWNKTFIDAVIFLPSNLFYTYSIRPISSVLIVFNKEKVPKNDDQILFINGIKLANEIRLKKLPEKLVDYYENYKEVEGVSKIVSVEEIKHQYELNFPIEKIFPVKLEHIDLEETLQEFKEGRQQTIDSFHDAFEITETFLREKKGSL